jgi:protein SCO1/2
MTKRNTIILLTSFFILLSAAFMTWFYNNIKQKPKTLEVMGLPGHTVKPFSFVNQDGKTITNKDVEGKVYVVEYFFTTCEGICPKMNESMDRVYRAYKGNNDFMILSHTVDPEVDTVAQIKAYSKKFDANPAQWMFLTGDKQALYDAARESYLITAVDTLAPVSIKEDFIHDNHFVLVDRTGHLRGRFYDGLQPTSVDSLISDIKVLLNEK